MNYTDSLKKSPHAHNPQTSGQSSFTPERMAYVMVPIVLLILGFFLWGHTLKFPFLFDDIHNIVQADHIKQKEWYEFFFIHGRWITCAIHSFLFHRVGLDPFWYRLIPLCIHIFTSIALFFLVHVLAKYARTVLLASYALPMAAITALLFLIHPIQTQTVLYVVQAQCEGLAACCIVLTVLFMSAFLLAANRCSPAHPECSTKCGVSKDKNKYFFYTQLSLFILMALTSFISFGSKEVAIMTPLLCMLVDWFFISQGQWHIVWRHRWMHLFLIGFYGVGYMIILKPQFFINLMKFKHASNNGIGNVITTRLEESIGIYPFFISQAKVLLHYLSIFIFPFGLSPDYGWKLDVSLLDAWVLSGWLVLLSLIGFIFFRLYKNKTDIIAFGLLWFFITVAPRSSVIPGSELVTDYKTYVASVGIFMLMAHGLCVVYNALYNRARKRKSTLAYRASGPIAFAIAAALSVHTFNQSNIWSSGETFWQYIMAANDTPRAYNNYALELITKNDFAGAQRCLEVALEKDNQYTHAMSNLAFVYAKQKLWPEAISLSLASVKLSPSVEAYNNLAYYLYKVKEYDAALTACDEALRIKPGYKPAIFIAARNRFKKEDFEATRSLLAQCTGDFKHPKLHALHARTFKKLKNFDAAIAEYKLAIRDLPARAELYREMGDCFSDIHDHQKAGVLYAAATQLDSKARQRYV